MVCLQEEEPEGKKRRRGAALDDDAEDDSDFDDLRDARGAAKEGAKSVRRAATEGAQTRGGRSSAGRTAGGRSLGAKTAATTRGNASQHSGDRWALHLTSPPLPPGCSDQLLYHNSLHC